MATSTSVDSLKWFLTEKISQSAPLTANEQKIAQYYLTHFPDAAISTLHQISQSCQVSTASVTRFASKLGFTSFRELRKALSDILASDARKPTNRLSTETAHSAVSAENFSVSRLAQIDQALSSLDRTVLNQVIELLAQTERGLYLAALVSGRPLVEHFGDLLSFVRGNFTVLGAPDLWPYQLTELDKESVVVVSMYNRSPSSLIKLLQLAQRKGATTIVISNHEQWRSLVEADYSLVFPTESGPGVFTSRLPLLAIYEYLVENVAQQVPERAASAARARAIEENFQHLGTHNL